MKRILLLSLLAAVPAYTFCGFYVAKADTQLFNEASKVVVVRDGTTTVLTMANDFQGDLTEFATVFPVPVVLEEDDIRVVDMKTLDHLDQYSSPRLVEYHDDDPCLRFDDFFSLQGAIGGAGAGGGSFRNELQKELGVTIEAEYTVGEYDILILSAEESDGLETWLKQNGYRIPKGASEVLGSYLKQNMKFFVARVNLEKQTEAGFSYLRPLQVRYESKKFALPIRLGTVNAKADQELFAFVITKKGRVECSNYKTIKLPTGMDLPMFVRDEFDDFYKDMFYYQVAKAKNRAVFTEYAWNMNWCDPCAADPLSPAQLAELGCFWVDPEASPGQGGKSLARQAYVTRLHVKYNAETFPEDMVFQNTGDESNFQGRYVLRHPWKGKPDACEGAKKYFQQLPKQMEQRAENLAEITGWDLAEIKAKMDFTGIPKAKNQTLKKR